MKLSVVAACFFLLVALPKASPYNKYGRTCRDILCIKGQEECVMEHDACTGYTEKCGSFPTCKRKPSTTKRGCASIKCEPGHFCSIRQENCSKPPCEIKPVCIAFRTPAPTKSTYSGFVEAVPPSTTSRVPVPSSSPSLKSIFQSLSNALGGLNRSPQNNYNSYGGSSGGNGGQNRRTNTWDWTRQIGR